MTNAADAIGRKGDTYLRVDNQLVSGRISNSKYFWICCSTPGEYIELRVIDTGHGMDPDVVALIFDLALRQRNPDADWDCPVFRVMDLPTMRLWESGAIPVRGLGL